MGVLPFWLMKCRACYWYDGDPEGEGICGMQSTPNGTIVNVRNDSYCPDWLSARKEGYHWSFKEYEKLKEARYGNGRQDT